jgi:hypothetical protein
MDLFFASSILSAGWLLLFIVGLFIVRWHALWMLLGLPGAIFWPFILAALRFEWVP